MLASMMIEKSSSSSFSSYSSSSSESSKDFKDLMEEFPYDFEGMIGTMIIPSANMLVEIEMTRVKFYFWFFGGYQQKNE